MYRNKQRATGGVLQTQDSREKSSRTSKEMYMMMILRSLA